MRILPPDGVLYRDVSEWSATIRWIDRKTIEIMGANSEKAPSRAQWRAIKRCCREWGADEFVFWRVKGGVKTLHRINVGGA